MILIAHGSRDPAWRVPFERLAERVGAQLAFMELEAPSVSDAVARAAADGADTVRLLPLFMAVGRHVKRDIPACAEAARCAHPALTVELLPALGESERFWDALATLVAAEVSADDGVDTSPRVTPVTD